MLKINLHNSSGQRNTERDYNRNSRAATRAWGDDASRNDVYNRDSRTWDNQKDDESHKRGARRNDERNSRERNVRRDDASHEIDVRRRHDIRRDSGDYLNHDRRLKSDIEEWGALTNGDDRSKIEVIEPYKSDSRGRVDRKIYSCDRRETGRVIRRDDYATNCRYSSERSDNSHNIWKPLDVDKLINDNESKLSSTAPVTCQVVKHWGEERERLDREFGADWYERSRPKNECTGWNADECTGWNADRFRNESNQQSIAPSPTPGS